VTEAAGWFVMAILLGAAAMTVNELVVASSGVGVVGRRDRVAAAASLAGS